MFSRRGISMVGGLFRFIGTKHFYFSIEVGDNLIQILMMAGHDDGNEILYALVDNLCRPDDEVLALLGSHEPAQEETVALGLLVVGIVHI